MSSYIKKWFRSRLRRQLSIAMAAVMVLASFSWLGSVAQAAGSLDNAKLTLGDPRPSTGSDQNVAYTFTWRSATTATLRCVTYEFWTTANGTTEPTGMVTNGSTKGTFTGTGITDGNWSIPASPVEGTIKVTNTTGDSISSGTQVTMPFTVPRNPSTAGSFYTKITNYTDTGCSSPSGGNDTVTVVATTVEGVTVSATIDPTLTFTVAGVAASTTYKGALSTADRCVDSATAVTFGTSSLRLSADTNYDCAQSLTTSTNAEGGYQVTIQGKQTGTDFLSMSVPTPPTITNWTGTNSSPTATPTSGSSEAFGYTTNDSSLSGTATRFTASDNLFAGLTTTADEVAYNSGPAASDAVNVGLRLRFTGTTEAGAYSGTLVYTCTPTF
jgi:hypothetical protein